MVTAWPNPSSSDHTALCRHLASAEPTVVARYLRACLLRFNDLGRELAVGLASVSTEDDYFQEASMWIDEGVPESASGFHIPT